MMKSRNNFTKLRLKIECIDLQQCHQMCLAKHWHGNKAGKEIFVSKIERKIV